MTIPWSSLLSWKSIELVLLKLLNYYNIKLKMIVKFYRKAAFLGQTRRMFASKVGDYELMDSNDIARSIQENTYNASV
jgi:hypothetical protein